MSKASFAEQIKAMEGAERARHFPNRDGSIVRPDACVRRTEQNDGDRWCWRCWRTLPPDAPLCAEGTFEPETYVRRATGPAGRPYWHFETRGA